MSKPIPFTYTGSSLVFLSQGKTTIISKDATNFELVIKALKAGNWDEVSYLANLRTVITVLSEGRVKVLDDDTVWVGDHEVKGTVVDRILEMLKLGLGALPYIRFLDLVDQNPSEDSKTDLYGFIEACNLPLTEDGHFLGYKIVTSNYLDIKTKTISNRIGDKPKMDRDAVDPNRNETCSTGLHVCSEAYLPHYGSESDGDRVIIVKVNPKNVVSVPTDYKNSKMRVCEYEVVDELLDWQERIRPWYTPEYSSSEFTPCEYAGDPLPQLSFDEEEEDEDDEDDDFDDQEENDTDSDLDAIINKLENNEIADRADVVAVPVADTYGIPYEKVDQIRRVRKMSADGWTRTAISDAVGLSRRQVGRILDGSAWVNIQ
jgi:hypothetical protein